MKKLVLVFICVIVLSGVGCGIEENQIEESQKETKYSDEITLMHVDGDKGTRANKQNTLSCFAGC